MKLIKKTNFNFLKISKVMALLSISCILLGIFSLISKGGAKLSIDFTGGTIAQLQFQEEIQIVDMNSDGILNILDIVILVEVILYEE